MYIFKNRIEQLPLNFRSTILSWDDFLSTENPLLRDIFCSGDGLHSVDWRSRDGFRSIDCFRSGDGFRSIDCFRSGDCFRSAEGFRFRIEILLTPSSTWVSLLLARGFSVESLRSGISFFSATLWTRPSAYPTLLQYTTKFKLEKPSYFLGVWGGVAYLELMKAFSYWSDLGLWVSVSSSALETSPKQEKSFFDFLINLIDYLIDDWLIY